MHGIARRLGVALGAIGAAVVVTAAAALPVSAHEEERSMMATDLVRQGIALIVNVPAQTDMALDKMNDALNAENTSGVFLPDVRKAMVAEKAGDIHTARALLEASIGAKPHMSGIDPAPIRQVAAEPATGAEAGGLIANDALDGQRSLTGANAAMLALSILAILGGAVLAFRTRQRAGLRLGRAVLSRLPGRRGA